MATLNSTQRSALESAIIKARNLAQRGARNSLMAIAVDQAEPFSHLSAGQRELRRRLRNRARLLGDTLEGKVQKIDHLSYELAYEYWHKMLFAKFLESNNLLVHPEHKVPVSLDDCEELAKEEKHADKWTAAAHYASRMLPAIFRTDDPLMQLDFSTEDRIALENLLAAIDENIFTADDSLGWVYQFWQSEAKDRINKSGDKIDGEKLPAVTQLFTEPYMVHFLIDNTIGAWWVSRHPNEQPPVNFEYLRLLPDGTPASGKFEGWATTSAALTMLDPCMGSGHFVAATFNVIAKLRMHEENLSATDAAKKTIAENIFGLELDPRCTQIAAFNLALAAWKFIGSYQPLPEMNLACSGIAPRGKKDDWIKLAGKDVRMQNGMAALYDLFQQAPELGSLLNPSTIKADAFTASFAELQPVLQKALEKEMELKNDEQADRGVMALGINTAAKILCKKFDLVITNVPYLGRGKQDDILLAYGDENFPTTKWDLAFMMYQHCVNLTTLKGTIALVVPQNWIFAGRYESFRTATLKQNSLHLFARLGAGAFTTISGEIVKVLLTISSHNKPTEENKLSLVDAHSQKTVDDKINALRNDLVVTKQNDHLKNPSAVIAFALLNNDLKLLETYAECYQGIVTGDANRFLRVYWEQPSIKNGWELYQHAPYTGIIYEGCHSVIFWEEGKGELAEYAKIAKDKLHDMHESGQLSWGKPGVVIGRVTRKVGVYSGQKYDNSVAAITPFETEHLPALYEYCSSQKFFEDLFNLDQKLSITNSTVTKVPFDLEHWQKIAEEKYPNGLPEPYSNDPTQWIFKGDIITAENPLQVAVARLLGYHYPEQPSNAILDTIEDDYGIVCIPSVNGEPAAADRLREFLKAAYGAQWNNHTIEELLKQTGVTTTNLETWLRESFFEQHFKLFHHRPFIWHIWDGRKDGFSVLVNYHKLTKENLQKIIFTCLGDWLRQCEAKVRNNESGADGLLSAAKELKRKLELILEGEPPYDIFIRWKPLHQQPISWEPDINDGVRLNIRPFMEANILRKKPNIKWEKDRGKNPEGSHWGEERNNDLHLTLLEKREAREKFEREQKEKSKKKTAV